MKTFNILIVIIALCTSPIMVNAGLAVERRAACNQDNVLRALEANAASATPFCSSYLNIPVKTVEVPGTHTTPSFTE